jgi:hypothetical protein
MQSLGDAYKKAMLAINLPWTEDTCTKVRLMVKSAMASGEGGILLIVGPPGTGKSHVTKQCIESVEKMLGEPGFKRYTAEIQGMPSGQQRDLSRSIVAKLRDPVGRDILASGTGKDFTHYLTEVVPDIGLCLVGVHESHNFKLTAANSDESTNLASLIKNLTNVGVSLILNALPHFEEPFRSHLETDSRTIETTVRLRSFRRTPQDVKVLVEFWSQVEKAMPVTFATPLSAPDIVLSLLVVGEGNLRKMCRLVEFTVNDVLDQSRSLVTLADFRRMAVLKHGEDHAKGVFTGALAKVL